MGWTQKDIEKLNLKSNIDVKRQKNNVFPKKINASTKKSIEKDTIKTVLWVLHREKVIPDYVEELKFLHTRKFRFDWALPSIKVAIEYEGVISSKSRHTTISGYSTDCEKYNLAAIEGWRVLRYTAKTYKNLERDLKNLLKK